jgi:hypothetical protein
VRTNTSQRSVRSDTTGPVWRDAKKHDENTGSVGLRKKCRRHPEIFTERPLAERVRGTRNEAR